jgi:hypothetical protein
LQGNLPQLYGLQVFCFGFFYLRASHFALIASLFAGTASHFGLSARMVRLACKAICLMGQALYFNGLVNGFASLPLRVVVLAIGIANPSFIETWRFNSSKLAAIRLGGDTI